VTADVARTFKVRRQPSRSQRENVVRSPNYCFFMGIRSLDRTAMSEFWSEAHS